MSGAVIEVEGLWFSYNGSPVLENVGFQVEAGDFVAVTGPNGGGKTTLVKLIVGLLSPSRGRVSVLGGKPREAAGRIGYVPQDTGVNLSFPIRVENFVLMGRLNKAGGWFRFGREDRRSVAEALDRVGMPGAAKRRYGELSGGQRQRVCLARALISRPEVIVLDEPTSGVDSQGQAEFYDLLEELNDRSTILVVSHDLMSLACHARSVICVNHDAHRHEAADLGGGAPIPDFTCSVEMFAHGLPQHLLKPGCKD